MYKMLIIDDEPLIRLGLRTIIDWPSFDIEICGEAETGREGLRLCREVRPDLAIVDIKMPGIDGLQLIEETRREGIDCDFIVLSGYTEFGYARKAIEFGVSAYLLKPIEEEELAVKVKQLHDGWRNKRESLERQEDIRRLKRDQALRLLLTGQVTAESYAGSMELLGGTIRVLSPSYQVVLLGGEHRELEHTEKEWLLQALQQLYEGNRHVDGIGVTMSGYVAVIAFTDRIVELPADMLREAKERFGLELVCAPGPLVEEPLLLAQSYRAAESIMKRKFLSGRLHGVIVPAVDPVVAAAGERVSLEEIADKAAKAIDACNHGLITRLLSAAKTEVIRLGWTETQIKSGFTALYADVLQPLAAANEKVRAAAAPLHEMIEGMQEQYTLDGLAAYLERHLHSCCDWRRSGKPDHTFQNILDFISIHPEDMKLESLALLFNYNSSYLGKLFKSQTGLSFNAYVNRIRMEKAKRLLAEGRKVYEVAALVGYANVDYFHLKFKKIIGVSPSSYREQTSKG